MRIVYCTDTVYRLSGMDIVTMTKAEALAEIPGNQVWVVAASNPHSLVHRLKKASMIDLNIPYYEHDSEGPLRAILDLQEKRKLHKQKLTEFLENIAPDVVISTGILTKFFVPTLKEAEKYKLEEITQRWMTLFEDLLAKKRGKK